MIQITSVFSIVSLFLAVSIVFLSAKSKINLELKTCLSQTTDFNRYRKNNLKKLFALNPKAKTLRTKRRLAENAYRAAPTPPLRAAAWTALQAVKVLQKVFRASQLAILSTIRTQTLAFNTKTLSRNTYLIEAAQYRVVQSYPSRSDSPSYKPATRFSQKTRVFLKKKFYLAKKLPAYFQSLLKSKKGIVECGSTLTHSKAVGLKLKLLGGRSF